MLFKKVIFPMFLLFYLAIPAFANDADQFSGMQDTSVISSSLAGAIQHAIGNPLTTTQTVTPALKEVLPVTTTTTSLTTESFPFTSIVPVTTTTQVQTGSWEMQSFMHDAPVLNLFYSTLQTMTESQFQAEIPIVPSIAGMRVVQLNGNSYLSLQNGTLGIACETSACIPASAVTLLTPVGKPVVTYNGQTIYTYVDSVPTKESIQVNFNYSTNAFSPAPANGDYTGKLVTVVPTSTPTSLIQQEYIAYTAGYKAGSPTVIGTANRYFYPQYVSTGSGYLTLTPSSVVQLNTPGYATPSVLTSIPIYSTSTSTSLKPVTTTSTVTVPTTTSSTTFKTVYIPLKSLSVASSVHLSGSNFTTYTSTVVGPPVSTKTTLIKSAPVVVPLSSRWNSLPGPGSPTLLQLSPWSNPISLIASLGIGAILPSHAKAVWFGQIAKNHPFMSERRLRAPAPVHVLRHQKNSIIHHI
jgi:hypothetical protein